MKLKECLDGKNFSKILMLIKSSSEVKLVK